MSAHFHLSRTLGSIPCDDCLSSSWLLSVDRKSTRLNSSHSQISYAVFCLKKKKKLHRYEYVIIRLNYDHVYTILISVHGNSSHLALTHPSSAPSNRDLLRAPRLQCCCLL